MTPDARRLLGACGLYCGACYHYRASLPEGQHLLSEVHRQGRPLEGFVCQGCRSNALYIHPGCANCDIRACADSKGLQHCGDCPELPCARLKAFQHDGHPHHLDILAQLENLRMVGSDRWLAKQVERWRCKCGAGYSWYETICANCGSPLNAYRR